MRWPFMLKKTHDTRVGALLHEIGGLTERNQHLEARHTSNNRWMSQLAGEYGSRDMHGIGSRLGGEILGANYFNAEVASRYTDEQIANMSPAEYAELRKELLPPNAL